MSLLISPAYSIHKITKNVIGMKTRIPVVALSIHSMFILQVRQVIFIFNQLIAKIIILKGDCLEDSRPLYAENTS